MASIYLIRHAQASFGSAEYDRLSALGCRQAGVLAEYLHDCGIHFDAIYSGDLQRQLKTAKIVSGHQPHDVPHHVDSRFNEVRNDEQIERLAPEIARSRPAVYELIRQGLQSSKDYQKAIEATFNYWVSPQCDEMLRNETQSTELRIQSWTEYSNRVREGLIDVMKAQGSGKTVGVFTSGGTIATIVSQVLELGSEYTYKFFEPSINCAVTRLFYSGRRVSLSYFNDHSFLDLLGQQRGEQLVTYR